MARYTVAIDLKGGPNLNPDRRVELGVRGLDAALAILKDARAEGERAGHEHGDIGLYEIIPNGTLPRERVRW